ncbi:MAG: NlpC/P60 family protein [Peptostreptococcaceae bacterium]
MINIKKIKRIVVTSAMAMVISLTAAYIPGSNNKANALLSEEPINYNQRSTKIGTVKPCDFLNIRSGPGINNSVVGKVYTNNQVTILETNSNGWHKINTNGTIGWVSGTYISVKNQQSATQNNKVNKVIDIAKKQLGKPYGWGSSGPNSFDCSGLTYYAFKNGAGINLPRTSREQAKIGKLVNKSDLQPGDLVFFATSGKGISHVGIYIGGSKLVHSTQPGDVVKIDKMNSSYYTKTYVTARRIL